MKGVGTAQHLVNILFQYKIDVTASQEMCGAGTKFLEKIDYPIYYCGHSVTYMRLPGKFRNFSLINIHAPTEKTVGSKKDTIYEAVEQYFEAYPRYVVV